MNCTTGLESLITVNIVCNHHLSALISYCNSTVEYPTDLQEPLPWQSAVHRAGDTHHPELLLFTPLGMLGGNHVICLHSAYFCFVFFFVIITSWSLSFCHWYMIAIFIWDVESTPLWFIYYLSKAITMKLSWRFMTQKGKVFVTYIQIHHICTFRGQ